MIWSYPYTNISLSILLPVNPLTSCRGLCCLWGLVLFRYSQTDSHLCLDVNFLARFGGHDSNGSNH